MTTLLLGSIGVDPEILALVGALRADDGTVRELGSPQVVNYREAEDAILGWQGEENPAATIVLLDQPTIVRNSAGQRPVEYIVVVSRLMWKNVGAHSATVVDWSEGNTTG